MKNLLSFSVHHGYSSEQRVFASLLRLRDNRYTPHVVYNAWTDHSQGAEQFEQEAQMQVVRFDTGWRANPDGKRSIMGKAGSAFRIYRSLPRLVNIARERKPDVIYSCQQHWDVVVAMHVAQKLNIPQMIHLHYPPVVPLDEPAPQLPRKRSVHQKSLDRLRTCDHIVTVSQFIRDQAIEFGAKPERVTSLTNTMATYPLPSADVRTQIRAEFGIPQNAPVIGIVGRVEEWKGQEATLTTFARIATSFPDAHLMIVGTGPQLEELKTKAGSLGLQSRVHFTGWRSDVRDLMAAFDIFSHPSRYDPAPLSVLDACLSALPVVAYAEGGACEFIVDGKTGFLTKAKDFDALTQAYTFLLENPEQAKAMGIASRRRIESEYHPDAAGKKFGDIIVAVANQKPH